MRLLAVPGQISRTGMHGEIDPHDLQDTSKSPTRTSLQGGDKQVPFLGACRDETSPGRVPVYCNSDGGSARSGLLQFTRKSEQNAFTYPEGLRAYLRPTATRLRRRRCQAGHVLRRRDQIRLAAHHVGKTESCARLQFILPKLSSLKRS